MFFKNTYRIVENKYCGYEVQIKRGRFPIRMQVGINTHINVERAEQFARNHAREKSAVKYLETL